jgi:hypothetical protein
MLCDLKPVLEIALKMSLDQSITPQNAFLRVLLCRSYLSKNGAYRSKISFL